jgi:hypothetical protein
MSFRQFGGLQYAARNNIVSSNYNTNNNLQVTQNVGQSSSYINCLSDLSGNFIGDLTGNIVGGNTGDLLYQSSADTTSFLTPGNSGYVLTSNGTSNVPSWQQVTSGSIPINSALGTTYYPSLLSSPTGALTEIYSNSGLTYNVSANTLSVNISGNATTATTATTSTNLSGGNAGTVPYQSGTGTTSFTSAGASGQVLTSNGTSPPTWTTPSGTTQWTTSGSNIYYNAGNVGIGNNNPNYNLDISGNLNINNPINLSYSPNNFNITNLGYTYSYTLAVSSLYNAVELPSSLNSGLWLFCFSCSYITFNTNVTSSSSANLVVYLADANPPDTGNIYFQNQYLSYGNPLTINTSIVLNLVSLSSSGAAYRVILYDSQFTNTTNSPECSFTLTRVG